MPLNRRKAFGKLKMMKKFLRCQLFGGEGIGRWDMIQNMRAREYLT